MPDTPLRFDHLALPVYDAARQVQRWITALGGGGVSEG